MKFVKEYLIFLKSNKKLNVSNKIIKNQINDLRDKYLILIKYYENLYLINKEDFIKNMALRLVLDVFIEYIILEKEVRLIFLM